MHRRTTSRWGPLACLAVMAACTGGGDDPTDQPATETGQPVAAAGFTIGGVTARNAELSFVADVVQAASGDVIAVGRDLQGHGAVHLVAEDGVTVLHAGAPLGNPTGVDLDAAGTVFLTDAGGADDSGGDVATTDQPEAYPTGGLFTMSASPGAPTLVTDTIASGQGLVAAAGGVLYVTGFTVDRAPAVFSVEGGTAQVIASGAPLVQPGDISVVNDPDATQIWVIDVSGGQDGVDQGGANLIALNPPDATVIEVSNGMTAIGVTGRGPDALVTTRQPDGSSRIQIVDVTDGSRRDVEATGIEMSVSVTGAGAGADPRLPVWAGGNSGQVFVTTP